MFLAGSAALYLQRFFFLFFRTVLRYKLHNFTYGTYVRVNGMAVNGAMKNLILWNVPSEDWRLYIVTYNVWKKERKHNHST